MTDRDRLSISVALATLLTSSALFAVFLGARWVPALAGVIAVVAGCSIAARHLRLPVAFGPLLMVIGVTGYVTVLFASSSAVAGILPGPAALRLLQTRASEGFADIEALAPPVPTRPGLLLIGVVGVALVAFTAEVLATTLRQPPAAGLPLLALFAVPSAVAPGGSGIVPFGLAVSGYLLLLATDGRTRLARWGRPLAPRGTRQPVSRLTAASYGDEPPTGAMGRRIGLAAIGLAVVVPVALPTMGTPLFAGNGTGGSGAGGGGTSVQTYNPIVRLREQLNAPQTATLLTLKTNEATPTGYLRMAGLDVFDGRTWSQSSLRAEPEDRISEGRVLPPPAQAGATVRTTVSVSDRLDARWLPLPYQPTAIRINGDWRFERRTDTVFSTRDNARSKQYEVTSAALKVDPGTLDTATLDPSEQASFANFTSYPVGLPAMIKETSDRVVLAAKAETPYQRAVALQQYFRSGEFRYSLQVPAGNSTNVIVNFLERKQGFCEQYAATMALFARMQGIPARVAVGFTYGTKAANGDQVITTHDAHAWPELYFSEAGWLPFEPTPGGGQGQPGGRAVAPPYTNGADTEGDLRTNPGTADGSLADRRFNNAPEGTDTAVPVLEAPGADGGSELRQLGWLVLLPLLLCVPALARALTRRRRWRMATSANAAAHAAWADLRDGARDLGVAWPASASPRGVAGWFRSRMPLSAEAGAALDALVGAEERARYRRDGASGVMAGPGAAALRAHAAAVRSELRGQASAGSRWRATLLPPSGTDRLRRLTTRVAVAGDRYDRNLARWARSVFRRRTATPVGPR